MDLSNLMELKDIPLKLPEGEGSCGSGSPPKLHFLFFQGKYRDHCAETLRSTKPVAEADAASEGSKARVNVRILHGSKPDFNCIARQFSISEEWKACVKLFT